MTGQGPSSSSKAAWLAWWWGPVLLYAAAIFAVSALSSPPAMPQVRGFDKLVHLVEYAGFGALFSRAIYQRGAGRSARSSFIAAWALGTLYGLTDELHQLFVPGRVADAWDLLADSAGSLCGAALHFAGFTTRERRG